MKQLQKFLARTGFLVHVTTIARLRHKSGLWGKEAGSLVFQIKTWILLEKKKKTLEVSLLTALCVGALFPQPELAL